MSVKTGCPPDFLCSAAPFPVLLSATGTGSPAALHGFLGEGRLSSTSETWLSIKPLPHPSIQVLLFAGSEPSLGLSLQVLGQSSHFPAKEQSPQKESCGGGEQSLPLLALTDLYGQCLCAQPRDLAD